MTNAELNALREFADLFRAQVQSSDSIREKRMRELWNRYSVCRQAVLEFVQTEGPRKDELDGILHKIHPRQYPRAS
jgi:hypothetical protein